MKKNLAKALSIIKYISFILSAMPFCIAVLSVYFMADTIPIHFDRFWEVDGYGSNLNIVLSGLIFSLTSLILPITFERVKMVDYGKLICFMGAILMALAFVFVLIDWIVRAFEISGVVKLGSQQVTSFVCSCLGVALVLFGSIAYFLFGNTTKSNKSNAILSIGFSLVGSLVATLCWIVDNYFSLLILGLGIAICVIFIIVVLKRLLINKQIY